MHSRFLLIQIFCSYISTSAFFVPPEAISFSRLFGLSRVSIEDAKEPIAFVDENESSFIECYADSIAELDGVHYTIGVPCDHSVALSYFDENDQLLPIELDDDLMDDVFPIAERIVDEEFGEELVLQRTPQTLTLVGELEGDEENFDDDDDEDGEEIDGDQGVEVLLSFEYEGKEVNLVRFLDPIILVGKDDKSNPNRKMLLSPEESPKVMPQLQKMFMECEDAEISNV
mmetsp:Transcript_14737/g.22496  ORF Transcript_14737/g.22496 Transcript_14737/m.22496 type:complete len:229 (+) Transcript_14737:114-800(+)